MRVRLSRVSELKLHPRALHGEAWPYPPLFAPAEWTRVVRQLGLTRREAEVVWAVSRGLRYAALCQRLGIAAPTVKTLMHRAYRKLGCSDRTGLVLTLVHLRDGRGPRHPMG